MSFLYIASYPSPSQENATILRSSLIAMAFARALPSYSISLVLFSKLGRLSLRLSYCTLYFTLYFFIIVASYNLYLSYSSGFSLVSSILMAKKLALLRLSASRNYPVYYNCIPIKDLLFF
jgi:hypothetical protein